MKKLSLIFALLLSAGACFAQNQALNIDDIAPTNSGSPPVGWAYPPCFGSGCAGGSGVLVNTATTTAVSATGVQNVKVAAINGMMQNNSVVVDTGSQQEVVVMTQVYDAGLLSPGFQATFTKTHTSGVSVVSFLQTVNNVTPSLDGGAMQLSNYGQAQSNVLWFYDNAPQDNAAYLYGDQWFYLDANGSKGNGLEFDMFQYLHAGSGGVTQNTRLMYGGQCDLNHHLWDVWNSFTSSWVATTLACNPSVLTWHHLVQAGHRVVGDTSCTSGYPCMHFDYVIIDGALTNLNNMQSAGPLPAGWSEQTGIQDQLDVGSTGAEQTEWVDLFSFYTKTTGAPFFTSGSSAVFTVSTPGSFTVAALGMPIPSFTESGPLPAGVTFVDNGNGTATLAGTPGANAGGFYTFTLTAANGMTPNATQSFGLTVNQPAAFVSQNAVTFIANIPSSFTVAASGFPLPIMSIQSGSLPAGLTFTGGNGSALISGTPTTPGVTSLTLGAKNGPTTVTQPFTLTVISAPVTQQIAPYTLNAVQPPTTPSNTNYAAWQTVLNSGNNLLTGATAIVSDGCSIACSQLTYVDQGTTFPILSWTAEDALVATYTSAGKKANLIQAASIEGGTNNGTSSYVYTQNWADLLDVDGSGNRNPILTYTVGNKYRTAQYIYANSHYWQMQGIAADPGNPTYGSGCIAAVQPAFVHGAGPYTESGAWPCTWAESQNTGGTHAPLQDVICTTNFKGTNCWELTVTNIVGSGSTVTVTVANPPTYPAAQSLLISGITNAGYTALNGTWTMTGSNATTVTFANGTVFASCNAACLAPSGTVTISGSHLLNIATTNATNAMVASALPVAYEMPYAIYRNYFCDQVIKHYAAGQLNGGYLVCGFEGGGEYSSFDITQQPFYGSASQFRSIWLSNIDDFQAEQDATRIAFNPNLTIYGDMNAVGQDFAYTDQEAKLAASHNIGHRTNGLSNADINNIICSQGVTSAYCTAAPPLNACDNPPVSPTLGCTSGGWYHAMYSYPTMQNGNPEIGSLQTVAGSTPGNCQINGIFVVTGPLAPLAAGPNCPGGSMGLLNGLVALRTTGLVNGNSGPVENWNNTELYTNGPANCGTNCTHFNSTANPVGDLLFALNYNYSSTTFAQTSAAVLSQVIPYDASFALYLTAPSVFGGCPYSGGSQCSSTTFTVGTPQGIPAAADNLYEDASGNWLGPRTDSFSELPRFGYYTALSSTPSLGTVRTVTAGSYASLVSTIAAANCGDVVKIPAAVGGVQQTYIGGQVPITQVCDSNTYITIETDQISNPSFPLEGSRISPCYAGVPSLPGRPPYGCPPGGAAALMPKLILNAPSQSFFNLAQNGGSFVRMIGLEVTVDCSQTTANYGVLIHLGNHSESGDSSASHHVLDRMWIHGCELPNAPAVSGAPLQVQAGVTMNGQVLALIDSYLNDFYTTSASSSVDSQPWNTGNSVSSGAQPQSGIKVVNNFLEAGAECGISGGGVAAVTPSDVEFRLNHCWKPLQWRCDPVAGCPAGGHIIIKNASFELKNVQRVLEEGNVESYAWNGPGTAGATQGDQTAFAMLVTPKSQSGNCPLCIVTDATIRYNYTEHTANGIQLAAVLSDSGAADLGAARISVHDNIFDDVNVAWNPQNTGGQGFEFIANGTIPLTGQLPFVTISHNTFLLTGTSSGAGLGWFQQTAASPLDYKNVTVQDNIAAAPIWLSSAPGGVTFPGVPTVMNTVNPTFSWCVQGNLISAGNWGSENTDLPWPLPADNPTGGACHNGAVNNVAGTYGTLGFVNYNGGSGGDYHLAAGSPWKGTAHDGTDPGANVDLVNANIVGVR